MTANHDGKPCRTHARAIESREYFLPLGNRRAHSPQTVLLRISPADNNDAVDVIASRLRHLYCLQQGVLRATLTDYDLSTTYDRWGSQLKLNANCRATPPVPHLSRSGNRHGCYPYLAACHASPRGDSFHSIRDRIETIRP